MPSRDMLVRAAAAPSASAHLRHRSRASASAAWSTAAVGFAWIRARLVFGISVILMVAVAIVALIGDRRSAARRRAPAPQAAAAE
jgi:hypothetical protein